MLAWHYQSDAFPTRCDTDEEADITRHGSKSSRLKWILWSAQFSRPLSGMTRRSFDKILRGTGPRARSYKLQRRLAQAKRCKSQAVVALRRIAHYFKRTASLISAQSLSPQIRPLAPLFQHADTDAPPWRNDNYLDLWNYIRWHYSDIPPETDSVYTKTSCPPCSVHMTFEDLDAISIWLASAATIWHDWF